MNKLKLSVAALLIASASYGQTQCNGLTKDSVQCKNTNKGKVELCYLHDPNYKKVVTNVTVVCSGTTKKNKKCKNKTKHLSGLCHNHRE